MERVTFATSSGFVWLALAVHFAVGLASIVAGTVALSVTKGARLHKRSGMIFTAAMVVLGVTAMGIGLYENNMGQVFGGLLAFYFVVSAMLTVKSLPGIGQGANTALMVVAFICAAALFYGGVVEWMDPSIPVIGRPRVFPPLIGGSLLLLAAMGICTRFGRVACKGRSGLRVTFGGCVSVSLSQPARSSWVKWHSFPNPCVSCHSCWFLLSRRYCFSFSGFGVFAVSPQAACRRQRACKNERHRS